MSPLQCCNDCGSQIVLVYGYDADNFLFVPLDVTNVSDSDIPTDMGQ